MRGAGIAVGSALAAGLGLSGTVKAQAAGDIKYIPPGTPVATIQTWLDDPAWDTYVFQAGVHDFGTSGSLTVSRSLTITGEEPTIAPSVKPNKRGIQAWPTKILGGDLPIVVETPGAVVTVKNLGFDGFIGSAVDVRGYSGTGPVTDSDVTVSNCCAINAKNKGVSQVYGGWPIFRQGISVGNFWTGATRNFFSAPLKGTVAVENCESYYAILEDPHIVDGFCLWDAFNSSGLHVTFRNNFSELPVYETDLFSDPTHAYGWHHGISVVDNPAVGGVTIQGNHVIGGHIGVAVVTVYEDGDIIPGAPQSFVDNNLIENPNTCGMLMESSAPYSTATNNVIRGTMKVGIRVDTKGTGDEPNRVVSEYHTIRGNTLDMDAIYGINLQHSFHNTLQGNKLHGSYKYPFNMEFGSSDNLFYGNNAVHANLVYPDKPACTADNPGAALSFPFMTAAAGQYVEALEFSGSDYVDCGMPNPPLASNAITVAAWVKNPSGGDGSIVNQGGGWSDPGYSLFWYGGNLRVELQNSSQKSVKDFPAPDGNWHHIAFTWPNPGNEINLYIDGVSQTGVYAEGSQFTGPIGAPIQNLNIGRNELHQFYFTASIDEVHIYNTVLSQEQVRSLIITSGQFSPVLYYSCDAATIETQGPLGTPNPDGWFQVLLDQANAYDGIINLTNCPDSFEPAVVRLDGTSARNTVKGFSGGSVVDAPDFAPGGSYVFTEFGHIETNHPSWWYMFPPSGDNMFPCTLVSYDGYFAGCGQPSDSCVTDPVDPNYNATVPNYFERQVVNALPLAANFGFVYLIAPKSDYPPLGDGSPPPSLIQSVAIALTGSTIAVTDPNGKSIDIPDPAYPPVSVPKDNFITGLEPMAGAGGIGPRVSASNMSLEWQTWAQMHFSWLAQNPNATKEQIRAWLAANPEPPRH